jgi:hypothetical protein
VKREGSGHQASLLDDDGSGVVGFGGLLVVEVADEAKRGVAARQQLAW